MFVQYRPDQDVWAYGVEPAKVRYRLRLARYPALAETLQDWLQEPAQQRAVQAGIPLKLLDIGAGFGRTFLYLKAQDIAQHFDLVGLDIDPQRKDDVYADSPWKIMQGDAEQDLDFPDNSLDVIVCEQLLEHLNNPQVVLDNVHRMLKTGGVFVCGVPIFPEPIAKLRRWYVGRYGLGRSDHIQTYSLRSIRKDIASQFVETQVRGFRIVSGGLLRSLENHHWWYRFNRRLGALLPGLCIEIQLILHPKK